MPDHPMLIQKIIRTKRKTLAIEINPEGQLIVRAPYRISLTHIHDFVSEKNDWIIKKKAMIANRKPAPAGKQFIDGELFPYLGENYLLKIVNDGNSPLYFQTQFELDRSFIANAKFVFIDWYRQQALQVLSARVHHFAMRHHYRYSNIRISNAYTRWGSCSADGRLNFAWRLIMAPLNVIDYVVTHELAHLSQMNHSRQFWGIVEAMQPNYKKNKKWLKENGHLLHI